MTVVAVDNCTFTFGSGDSFSYSTDGGSTWTESTSTPTSTIASGNKVLLKGNITTSRPVGDSGSGSGSGDETTPNDNWIYSSGRYSVEGNIMSLVHGDNFTGQTIVQAEQFIAFFSGDGNLISADNLSLPATTLAVNCYNDMFQGCTSLTTAPSLPATALANGCYSYMFHGCTNLTTAPSLPATTLATRCYYFMFTNCTSLNYIKAMFTTPPSETYMNNWVNGVASSGTFVKNSAATWTNSCGISTYPCNWTVETASS